jgi:hypothetical protein
MLSDQGCDIFSMKLHSLPRHCIEKSSIFSIRSREVYLMLFESLQARTRSVRFCLRSWELCVAPVTCRKLGAGLAVDCKSRKLACAS